LSNISKYHWSITSQQEELHAFWYDVAKHVLPVRRRGPRGQQSSGKRHFPSLRMISFSLP
jgi:hypothetical protein